MSDQVYDDPQSGDSSYEADVDAGYEDDDEKSGAEGGLAGSDSGLLAGSAPDPDASGETSHDADVEAGYDDDRAADNDRPDGAG